MTSLLVLPIAFAIWRASAWPWLFLGALLIFVVNAATGAQAWGFLFGNLAEVIFVLSLLATEQRFRET